MTQQSPLPRKHTPRGRGALVLGIILIVFGGIAGLMAALRWRSAAESLRDLRDQCGACCEEDAAKEGES